MSGMRFEDANEMLKPGYQPFESGYQELGDGKWVVAGLTRMVGSRAKMIHWWFGWLGDIAHRDPTVTIPEAVVRQKRQENLTPDFARRLHTHCVEEMGYLADILPTLYKRVTLDNSF